MSKLVRITPPAADLLTLDEVRLHLRLDTDGSPPEHPDDAMLEALIEAATNDLDAPDGFLGRALCTQTWDLYLDEWQNQIFLPFPPLQTVTSIKYLPPTGAQQTLSASVYQVVQGIPSSIVTAEGQQWPDVRAVKDAIVVRFVAGYGSPADVPALIKQYALMQITAWYEHRSTIGQRVEPTPFVRHMLQSYRVGF
jgi:uncharacterized phiE125 gp8 family phage protein